VIVLGLTATTWLQVKSKNFDPKADMPGVGFRIDASGAVFVQVQFMQGVSVRMRVSMLLGVLPPKRLILGWAVSGSSFGCRQPRQQR